MLTDLFSCLPLLTLGVMVPLFGQLSSMPPLSCSILAFGRFSFFQGPFGSRAHVHNHTSLIQPLLWEPFPGGIVMRGGVSSLHVGNPWQTELTVLLNLQLSEPIRLYWG